MSYDEAKYVFDNHQKYAERKNGSTKYFREFLESEIGLKTEQIQIFKRHFGNKNVRRILSKEN
jgi:hypothetical protein